MNDTNRWFRGAAGAALLLLLALPAAADAPPPARPEQLRFPELRYAPPRAADCRVMLKGGVPAYLVPDRSTPLVTIHVLMRIGPDLAPAGKEGLPAMAMNLLTRSGTRTRTAQQVEDRASALGAQLESDLGSGGGGMFGLGGVPIGPACSRATLNLLAKDVDEGLALLVECLKSPAFEDERIKLRREQELQQMKQRNDESAAIEEREWGFLMRGGSHWTNRWTTRSSIESITREDLAALVRRYVGPKNFVIAVSGDFDRATMAKKLEAAFVNWPTPGVNPGPPAAPAEPSASGWHLVDKDVNQGRVSIGLRTLDRFDPDYQAARVMNDILGGGGFSSRLTNRIRSDEGLAYSVRSVFEGGLYYPDPWRIQFQSKVRSVPFAIQIALAEVRRMRDSLVNAQELEVAKSKFIEGFPAQFETANAVAGALAVEELTGRYQKDPGYYTEYRDRVRAVSAADLQRVARRLLDPAQLAVLMVGNAKEILTGDPRRDAQIGTLAGGDPKRLPLRDPMTMKPMP